MGSLSLFNEYRRNGSKSNSDVILRSRSSKVVCVKAARTVLETETVEFTEAEGFNGSKEHENKLGNWDWMLEIEYRRGTIESRGLAIKLQLHKRV